MGWQEGLMPRRLLTCRAASPAGRRVPQRGAHRHRRPRGLSVRAGGRRRGGGGSNGEQGGGPSRAVPSRAKPSRAGCRSLTGAAGRSPAPRRRVTSPGRGCPRQLSWWREAGAASLPQWRRGTPPGTGSGEESPLPSPPRPPLLPPWPGCVQRGPRVAMRCGTAELSLA